MEAIIILIIFVIIGCFLVDNKKPPCYKPCKSEGANTFNPCCTGNACAFKLDCKYYQNYVNDN